VKPCGFSLSLSLTLSLHLRFGQGQVRERNRPQFHRPIGSRSVGTPFLSGSRFSFLSPLVVLLTKESVLPE
jgi:hypothetical protein